MKGFLLNYPVRNEGFLAQQMWLYGVEAVAFNLSGVVKEDDSANVLTPEYIKSLRNQLPKTAPIDGWWMHNDEPPMEVSQWLGLEVGLAKPRFVGLRWLLEDRDRHVKSLMAMGERIIWLYPADVLFHLDETINGQRLVDVAKWVKELDV